MKKIESRDWLITDNGQCQACTIPGDWERARKPYRLYRFLTDLEDLLDNVTDERQRLERIRSLVRCLLNSSEWLQGEYLQPDPDLGWSVLMLYDEPDFPLTIQTVVWLPGKVSPIHNHATWGVVAVISGQEKNIFWRRTNEPEFKDRLERVVEKILVPGDIISFMPDAIHSVEVVGNQPTVTFNVYGETNYEQRFEFDPLTHIAKNF